MLSAPLLIDNAVRAEFNFSFLVETSYRFFERFFAQAELLPNLIRRTLVVKS